MTVRLKPEVIEESVPTSVAPVAGNSEDIWGKSSPPVVGSNANNPSKVLLGAVIVLVALTVATLGVVGKQVFFNSSNSRTVVADETPEPSDTPVPTVSPTPEISSKAKVKIQVLNGSGTPGQAGKIATELEKADFVTPDAGNAGVDDQSGTVVEYSPKVDTKIVDEVIELLEKTFANVEAKSNSTLTTYHIVITTGQDPVE
jgi:hypothetical protein